MVRAYQIYASKSAAETLKVLETNALGLSEAEAKSRRLKFGGNVVRAKETTAFDLVRRQFSSPLTLMLIAAALVAFFLKETVDTLVISVILLINVGLSFFQEYRSETALRHLKSLVSRTATVRRGGQAAVRPQAELVPGDIVLLSAGDIVPADIRLIKVDGLAADESALTGESAPVWKDAAVSAGAPSGPAAAAPIALAGTTIASGRGEGVVIATGENTEFGQTVKLALETTKVGAFEESVRHFSVFLMKVVGVALILVFAGNLLIEGTTARAAEFLLFSLALAISVVPEALPAVVTLTFSRGALHLARKKVIVRRLSAIEDLGHVEILCTDKTGTITENKLRLTDVFAREQSEAGRLAALSVAPEQEVRVVSSFDAAIREMAARELGITELKRHIIAHRPFDPARRRQTLVLQDESGRGRRTLLIVKGAPEQVLPFCAAEAGSILTAERRQEILQAFRNFGRGGKRVLALAYRPVAEKENYNDSDESEMIFAGLLAFEDPLKSTAREAIRRAEELKVRVKILTGDGPEVASAVAVAAGVVRDSGEVMSGEELVKLTPEEFSAAAERFDVFARVTPEQKYRLIEVLERRYAVGFLGEGINDAPALRLAHVALAVDGAADAAKDAADVILLDHSLDVIVDGIREGRVIFANVAKYVRYSLSGNLGNMFSIAGISFLLPFLPMLPIQLLLVNLLTDIPLMAIAADRVDGREVAGPRRLHLRDLANYALLMGLVSTFFDFIFFGLFRSAKPALLQTMWFVESVLQELAVIFSMRTPFLFFRSAPPARSLALFALLAAAFTLGLPLTRVGQEIFHFARPSGSAVALVLLLVAMSFVVTELVKSWYRRGRGQAVFK
ncbi:HAD family hydrolase [Patescibacteria group bacterium]|nr:MAG: HAD family hydrolase [Patescibacteria group bacterium]